MGRRGIEPSEDAVITGARLRQSRESAGLSLSQLAGMVPYSRSMLGHMETGVRVASAEVIAWYQRACGPVDPVTAVSALGRADVDRRSFLRNAAYSAAVTATGLTSPPQMARLIRVNDSTRVGMAEIHAIQAVTDAFSRLDEVRGGGVGATAVAEFLATDVAALLRARFADSDVRAEAFSAASELAYLAGFKAHDAGKDGVAQRYYLSALRLAEESGMPGQAGFAQRILALHSLDVRQPQYAVPLAEEAAGSARGRVSKSTQVLFDVATARCHAETGDFRAARAALAQAEPWIDSDVTDRPRWAALFCPNQASTARQASKAFTAIGDLTEAERYLDFSHQVWNPQTHTRIRAISAAEVGLLRWRIGDYVGAVNIWRPAVPVLSTIASGRATKQMTRINRYAPDLIASATTHAACSS